MASVVFYMGYSCLAKIAGVDRFWRLSVRVDMIVAEIW
jgi:hypothetical protein